MLKKHEKSLLLLEYRIKRLEQFANNIKHLGIAIIGGSASVGLIKLFD